MKKFDELLQLDPQEWINSIPEYQKNRIEQLLSKGKDPLEVASIWLSASPQNLSPFGTIKKENIFLDKLMEEIEGFLCGDSKYEQQRLKLLGEVNVTHNYVIGVISSAIAPIVGSSGPFLAPVIAILLMSFGKITINAWCESCKERRNRTGEQ